MSNSLERRPDGSFALYIDGDLQFDSRDENIYHEGLILPALSVASRRMPGELRVLIIGGGDGLSAREVFKSERVASVDLVDHDPEILNLAKSEFNLLNESSLWNSKMHIHIKDAWQFAEEAADRKASYDVIVSDLTVPENAEGAKFHSVDWYQMMLALLSPQGVLAVNGVSPHATPLAFWSIFNSIRESGLHAHPYHVELPSFAEHGYGRDWGFFLAAKAPIAAQELNYEALAEPRSFLTDANQLMRLFDFEEGLYSLQSQAKPARRGSSILLRYFRSMRGTEESANCCTDKMRSSFTMETSQLRIPRADTGREILPSEVSQAMAMIFSTARGADPASDSDRRQALGEVIRQIPVLHESQTQELVADFLSEPQMFLRSIDLRALVKRMLQNAGQLPANFVSELRELASELESWSGDYLTPRQLGTKVIMVLTLVLVVGNLLYPDMVYAKGDGQGGAGRHEGGGWGDGRRDGNGRRDGDGRRDGRRDRRGDGRRGDGFWNDGGYYYGGPNRIIERPQRVEKIIEAPQRVPHLQIRNYSPGGRRHGPDSQSLLLEDLLPEDLRNMRSSLLAEHAEAIEFQAILLKEQQDYASSFNLEVAYGTRMVPREEALRLTEQAIARTTSKVRQIEEVISRVDELEQIIAHQEDEKEGDA